MALKEPVMEIVRASFRPEFLNRVDETIIFNALEKKELEQIVEILLKDVEEHMSAKSITLTLTPTAKELIVEKGTEPGLGARPLKRAIERMIEDKLAEDFIRGKFKEGATIKITRKEDELVFTESKKKCEEHLKECGKNLIREGTNNAECDFNCVDPKVIIKKK